jgi:predicted GNAT family acetyltransferase
VASALSVQNNSALDRFELLADGALAGIAEYQDTADARAFVHTEIRAGHEGHGYGRILVQQALDASWEEGFGVLPLCPLVRRFVESRPKYLALVPHWAREGFGLPL